MKTYNNLWQRLTSFENLRAAYEKARQHKGGNPSIQSFAEHWAFNLSILRLELITKTYHSQPLTRFVLRDPKTRVIYKSQFRDRIIHHALVNILQPIYEPRFIYDSYASRKGRGTTSALERYHSFLRQITHNGTQLQNARNDNIEYSMILDTLQGWNAYAMQGNTYRLRQRLTQWTTNELVRITAEHKAQRNMRQYT